MHAPLEKLDSALVKKFSLEFLDEIYKFNPPLLHLFPLTGLYPNGFYEHGHKRISKPPYYPSNDMNQHRDYFSRIDNRVINNNNSPIYDIYYEIAINALIEHGVTTSPESTGYLDVLFYIVKTGLVNKHMLLRTIMMDYRLDPLLEKIIPVLGILDMDLSEKCSKDGSGSHPFTVVDVYGDKPHLIEAFLKAGLNATQISLCSASNPGSRLLLENAGASSLLFCSTKSWPDYLETYFGLSPNIIEQSKNNFLGASIFGMASEFLKHSPFSSQNIDYAVFFLQTATLLYTTINNPLEIGAGLVTTAAINRFGILSKENAARAGMLLPQLLTGGSLYATASTLAGDFFGRGVVQTGFWANRLYQDKKERDARIQARNALIQATEEFFAQATLDTTTIEILVKYLTEDNEILSSIECSVGRDIALTPVIGPSGNIVTLEEAKNLITRNSMIPLTWEPNHKVNLLELHPVIQLKNILTCWAALLQNPSPDAQQNLFNEMKCAESGRNLFEPEKDEGIFINKQGFFIISKKTEISQGQKNITDAEGNYFAPGMQSDFFSKVKDRALACLDQSLPFSTAVAPTNS